MCRGHKHSDALPGAGGEPRVVGTGVTVSEILARRYVHGDAAAVTAYYRDVTVWRVKDALAYAHRFMEFACGAGSSQ